MKHPKLCFFPDFFLPKDECALLGKREMPFRVHPVMEQACDMFAVVPF